MFFINARDKTPIYEQLLKQLREQIAMGVLSADAPLPSVRVLSSELGINPNTIQRSYRMMEDEGLIYSIPGKGSFVTGDVQLMKKQQLQRELDALRAQILNLYKMGAMRSQIDELLDEIGKESGEC